MTAKALLERNFKRGSVAMMFVGEMRQGMTIRFEIKSTTGDVQGIYGLFRWWNFCGKCPTLVPWGDTTLPSLRSCSGICQVDDSINDRNHSCGS